MQPIKYRRVGERFNAYSCRLERLTQYTGKVLGEDATRWRHAFRTPAGELLVYTGAKIVAGVEGNCYDIRATIKRQEPAFRSTRISRPIIEPVNQWQNSFDIVA